ncbi:CDHR4 protein, partial [Centropus unirufus]|nr:CDHR4 protein [Centropus unirufus]
QVTLRAGAQLDARQVNQYNLTLRAACPGEDTVEKRLFVWVTVGLRCDPPFASAEGDVVWVPADVAPRTPLYAVLPRPLGGVTVSGGCPQPLQGGLTSHGNHDTPLTLTRQGLVLAPASGFDRSEDNQTFRLELEVTDRFGHNCSGAVRVEVLPPRRPRVTFPELQRAVTVPEGIGPLEVVTQVHASGDNVRYALLAPAVPALFTIDEETGKIRSTRRLLAAHAHLLVRAYNALQPSDHATAALNITVRGQDPRAPSCVPAISVYGSGGAGNALGCGAQGLSWQPPRHRSQVPETVSPGSTLVTLSCTDPAGDAGSLRYALEEPLASRFLFRMEGPRLQVNTTLDYDSEAAAATGFQFTATIVVTAGGQPPRSTHVPVLVTVTPVNEFAPTCPNGATFTVLETAPFGSAVGRVAGTDRDYPPDSLEYSLEEGPGPSQPFAIDAHTGEIRVVGPLDPQRHKSHRLTVRVTDTRHDVNPAKRRSCLCEVSVRLQAVPDQAPLCTPEVQELRIAARLGSRQPVTRLQCQGSPEDLALSYTIAGGEERPGHGTAPHRDAGLSRPSRPGNEDRRFQLEGNTLFYLPDGPAEPRTYVLLVEVRGSPGARRRSAVVALVVHVTPRSTPVPPSTTSQHTTLQKQPRVITRTEAVWHPPAWFVAVLTGSGALLLAALGCVARNLLHR